MKQQKCELRTEELLDGGALILSPISPVGEYGWFYAKRFASVIGRYSGISVGNIDSVVSPAGRVLTITKPGYYVVFQGEVGKESTEVWLNVVGAKNLNEYKEVSTEQLIELKAEINKINLAFNRFNEYLKANPL